MTVTVLYKCQINISESESDIRDKGDCVIPDGCLMDFPADRWWIQVAQVGFQSINQPINQ